MFGKKNMVKKTFKFIIKKLDSNKTYDIAIGHCMAEKMVNYSENYYMINFPII